MNIGQIIFTQTAEIYECFWTVQRVKPWFQEAGIWQPCVKTKITIKIKFSVNKFLTGSRLECGENQELTSHTRLRQWQNPHNLKMNEKKLDLNDIQCLYIILSLYLGIIPRISDCNYTCTIILHFLTFHAGKKMYFEGGGGF